MTGIVGGPPYAELPPVAYLSGLLGTGLVDVATDLSVLDGTGRWAVLVTFEGDVVCARFADWRPASPAAAVAAGWRGPDRESWRSSLGETGFRAAVATVRDRIAAGVVYQVNVCRVVEAALPDPAQADVAALHAILTAGNPAPFSGMLRLPAAGVHVASASPELFLRRQRDVVESGPIKGTGRTAADLTAKDEAENLMIVDLVRNDLSRVSVTGSVSVPAFLRTEQHPGLVHLVSTVRGELADGIGWPEIFAATFPPGSVSGAPKSTALQLIAELEPSRRGPYCGALGWVDADRRTAELAVGIRTFWLADGTVRFGTGAGITWASDPGREWDETKLKAERLVRLASAGAAPC